MGRVATRRLPYGPRRRTMLIDQSEIDALLAEAETLTAEAATESAKPTRSPEARPPPKRVELPKDPEIARILRLRVPLIVRLSTRRISTQGRI